MAIVALSEWESRQVDLKNAEVDMANLAGSLTQHAEDTFDLADTILTLTRLRRSEGFLQQDAVGEFNNEREIVRSRCGPLPYQSILDPRD